jgi:hypothetical protein
MKASEQDFSRYEGKEVIMEGSDNTTIKAVITGCDWDIGLTIQYHEHYLTCLNGEKSPISKTKNMSKELFDINKKWYVSSFLYIIRMVKKGRNVKIKVLNDIAAYTVKKVSMITKIPERTIIPSVETCPFSQ